METVDIFNYPIPRTGSTLGGNTTLRAVLANIDRVWEHQNLDIAALATRLAALTEAVRVLTEESTVDLADVVSAAESGVRNALLTGVVHVNVTVSGGS